MTAAIPRKLQLSHINGLLCSILSSVKCEKLGSLGLAQVALQELGLGLRKIDENQTVHSIRKLRVHVEAQQFSTELQILTQQHLHANLAGLDGGHYRRKIVQVESGIQECGRLLVARPK